MHLCSRLDGTCRWGNSSRMPDRTKNPAGADAARLNQVLRTLMPDWQATAIEDFGYLSDGYSNENYRFDYQGATYVLRVPTRPRPLVDRNLERAFYLETTSAIPVPELIALDTNTGYMLTRYEPGELLASSPPALKAIAAYLRPFHAALPPSARAYDPHELSRAYLSKRGAPGNIRRLAERSWQPVSVSTCHNDLNPWNIIRSEPDRWITLDWEWYGSNDPLFDLVTLHEGLALSHATFDENSLKQLVTLWAEEPVTESRLEQCLLAFWLREFAWAWAERAHGNEREEIQAQVEVAADRLAALSS